MTFAIFVCPLLSENASRMIVAAARLPGVRIGVISSDPEERAPEWARGSIHAHWRVKDILDVGQLCWATDGLARKVGEIPSRLYAAYEQAQEPVAEARQQLGIRGLSVETTRNFRDKARMKDVLRAHGVPCARHALVRSVAGGVAAGRTIGFPMVVKPPAGAGAVSTFRVERETELRTALEIAPPTAANPTLLEEFIVGDEHSLETISIDGRAVWHSLTHYRPTPLEVVRNPWIQWCIVLPREVDDPAYDGIKTAAARALSALGMTTGLSHMEWFRRPDGSVAIGEVGARPPGAQITTMVARANDFDFLQEWARVMIFGTFTPPVRKYAVGAAFLRGQGEGRVTAVHGLDKLTPYVRALVCDAKLPHVGQTPLGSYEGEGYVIVRHAETAVVERALAQVISAIRVELA